MHELGIMYNVVKTVEKIARQNGVTKIDTLVLQIGELSPIVPKYIEDCYPPAVDGSLLQETKLKIEIVPGEGTCKKCKNVFNIIANKSKCPQCQSDEWEILRGKEFMIKEIVAC